MKQESDRKSNRRSFLKKTAWAGAGATLGAVGVNQLTPSLLPEETNYAPNHSHWAKTQLPVNSPLDADIEVDVAIIGGGYTGLSAAYYIRKNTPAKNVVVLEASRCGNGASGRNGAMLLTMTADRFGQMSGNPAMDKRLYDLTAANIRTIRELSQQLNIDCELDANGALQAYNTSEEAAIGKQYAEQAHAAGMPFEFWDKERTTAALGSRVYEGALFDPSSGQVHPIKLVQMWKAAAESVGARIYEGTPVAHVDEGPRHTLRIASGHSVKAKSLVLATNAYSSKLGFFRNTVTPLHAYVGITPPLSEARLAEIGWRSRMPFNDSKTLVHYMGLTRDNRIHIGGGRVDYSFNHGLAERADQRSAHEALRRELGRIFPSLSAMTFETTWSGVVDMTLDFTSAVGRMGKHNNIYYGLGYCGHGVNLTSLFGKIIADMEAGHDEFWRGLPFVNHTPLYIPNEPFRWIGVQAALAYYRSEL